MRLLLADDDFTSRRILQAVLMKSGYEVVPVSDGIEAWQALTEPDHPRLAVIDWNMPGMDGVEVIRRLRKRETADPYYLIILTTRGEKKDIVEALNAGADDYIAKPYDDMELLARIGVGCRVVELQAVLASRVRDLDDANAAITHLARTDELTGLANRRCFNERLSQEISGAQRHGYPLALIMADLDRFKSFNDMYGHDAGDRVLKTFAGMLGSSGRPEDVSARWGGEEFVILLPHTDASGGARLAERIRTGFMEARCQGVSQPLSASFGVADFAKGDTAQCLIRRADNALMRAKQDGRNRVVLASHEKDAEIRELRVERITARNTLVLIIDDDPTTTSILVGILRRVGFQTACAANGIDGIALAQTLNPDLILLDVHLPDTDGFTVCRRMKDGRDTADIPVVFISANEDVSAKVCGFEAGGIDYITKPLAGVEIIARVRTHVRLKHAYDTLTQLQAERIERIAATQQMILPTPDLIPEARFSVCLKQIHGAGGDFYDVIQVGDYLVDYVVADASGHNLETSLWTTAMKTLLHEHASPLFDPSDILHAINKSLCRVMPEGMFFTVLYARLNRQTGLLKLVNGGHPPAICLPRGKESSVIRQTGDVIGAFADAGFGATEVLLKQGDRFFLYTDGLLGEVRNQEMGFDGLAKVCQARRDLPLGAMVETVTAEMLMGANVQDDIVLMGVEL